MGWVWTSWIVLIFYFFMTNLYPSCYQTSVGHLKPLGSGQPAEGNVKILYETLKPADFYYNYVALSKPVILHGAAKSSPGYWIWTDEFLKSHYGDILVAVDASSKENRTAESYSMKLSVFLQKYPSVNLYLVDTLPNEMHKDFVIPDPLVCGGFLNRIQDVAMWFSRKGSQSHLHIDTVENIHCMFSGRKQWFLVDKENSKNIILDHEEGDYCSVDVNEVDLLKYPFLKNMPWWNATLNAGDCIYVPYNWAHQVTSDSDRNFAINIWWTPMTSFNKSDCEDDTAKNTRKTFDKYSFNPAEQYRFYLLTFLERVGGTATFEDVHRNIVCEDTGRRLITREDFRQLDKNKDNILQPNEVHDISNVDLETIFDFKEPGMINIKGKSRRDSEAFTQRTVKEGINTLPEEKGEDLHVYKHEGL